MAYLWVLLMCFEKSLKRLLVADPAASGLFWDGRTARRTSSAPSSSSPSSPHSRPFDDLRCPTHHPKSQETSIASAAGRRSRVKKRSEA